ncbi:MAG: hypothetical protein AABZ80_10345 [Gemmatimonadota bacterium]
MARRGATKIGCLMQLLVLAAIGYFGANIGEVYWRYFRFKDLMQQEARFRSQKSIPEIRQRFRFLADSLGLPEDAGIVLIRKSGKQIFLESHYEETLLLPGWRKEVHFEVKAQGNL